MVFQTEKTKTGGLKKASRFSFAGLVLATALTASSCSLLETRPVQEMTNAALAMRAAREAKAEALAPDLYRKAGEWYQRAKREYRYKNFREARIYTDRARFFAERAEFQSLILGNKPETAPSDPLAGATAATAPGPTTPPPTAATPPSDSNFEPPRTKKFVEEVVADEQLKKQEEELKKKTEELNAREEALKQKEIEVSKTPNPAIPTPL
jgi:hypothetical protein